MSAEPFGGSSLFGAPPPWPYVALDIETAHGRPEAVEEDLRLRYSPPSNKTSNEAIGVHWKHALDEAKKKSALTRFAPIVIVSLATEGERRLLHWLRVEALREVDGGWVEGFESARAMLVALRNGLDGNCDDETVVIGHNVRDFDLPKLRWAYLHNGLRLPRVLAERGQSVFDSMHEFERRFTTEGQLFPSLDRLLKEFGIPSHKGEISGAMVPEMVEAGRVDELIGYALKDAAVELELYLRMTGQVDDAPVREEGAAA